MIHPAPREAPEPPVDYSDQPPDHPAPSLLLELVQPKPYRDNLAYRPGPGPAEEEWAAR